MDEQRLPMPDKKPSRALMWFYRFTSFHFILTSVTGILLYFRPGGARPGLYSDQVKEWLVMVHNGEWISFALLGRPFVSGIVMGSVLAFVLIRFSSRRFTRAKPRQPIAALEKKLAQA